MHGMVVMAGQTRGGGCSKQIREAGSSAGGTMHRGRARRGGVGLRGGDTSDTMYRGVSLYRCIAMYHCIGCIAIKSSVSR